MTGTIQLQMNDFLPLRDVVFQTLRQAILSGQLLPGERLMEIHLANQLGVSRTPVREALRKLELEGLVRTIPRKGAVVADIAQTDLEEVLEVREALEELAVRKACRNITEQEIQELRILSGKFGECLKRGDLMEGAETDVAFHEVISNATHNQHLIQMLNNLRGQFYRYRLEHLKNKNAHAALIMQHNGLCDALESRDEQKATELLCAHVRMQKSSILEYMRTKGEA